MAISPARTFCTVRVRVRVRGSGTSTGRVRVRVRARVRARARARGPFAREVAPPYPRPGAGGRSVACTAARPAPPGAPGWV